MPMYHPSMRDIYERLAEAGLDRPFVLKAALPDWWDDELAEVPANRELAEIYLAQNLALSLDELRHPDWDLRLPVGDVRFKRSQRTDEQKAQATALIAKQTGEILAEFIAALPPFQGGEGPSAVRRWIFSQGFQQVDLRSLLEYCWAHGIIVFHLNTAPRGAHRLDGMAMFCSGRPVIMLGSNRRPPSWLAFHLAHELAHILQNHVSPGGAPLADSDLERATDRDSQELEANRWALEILTGNPEPELALDKKPGPVGLVLRAEKLAASLRVDPGILILVFAQGNNAWKTASQALQHLQEGEHAKSVIDAALRARLDEREIPTTAIRFLHAVLNLS